MSRSTPITITADSDPDVVAWRRSRLLAAGFDVPLAERLAKECAVDLHALLELVARGCAPSVAARILEPDESDRRTC